MDLPDDLNEYLSGDSALSRQYRKEYAPTPPQALDRRVAALAASGGSASGDRASGSSSDVPSRATRCQSPCLAPLALAASVLLSMALVLAIVFGPQKPKRADDAPRLVRVAARADLSAAPVDRRPRLYSTDPPRPRTPSQWLAEIAALRRAGHLGEADTELRRFRESYPGYSTDDPGVRP